MSDDLLNSGKSPESLLKGLKGKKSWREWTKESGVPKRTLIRMCMDGFGSQPGTLAAALKALGYKLVIVPKNRRIRGYEWPESAPGRSSRSTKTSP